MVIACVAYNALYQHTEDFICHTFFSHVRSFNNIKTVAWMANNAPVPSL